MKETIKYIFLWLFIFIVGSLIVSFLIYPESFQSFKYNIKSSIPDINILQKSTVLEKEYCKENIIPRQVIFEFSTAYSYRTKETNYEHIISKWKDGTNIDSMDSANKWIYSCRIGSKEGENKDYIYCDNLNYSKTYISEDGTIGETITYDVDLGIHEVDVEEIKTWETLYGNESILKKTFEVVNYECIEI